MLGENLMTADEVGLLMGDVQYLLRPTDGQVLSFDALHALRLEDLDDSAQLVGGRAQSSCCSGIAESGSFVKQLLIDGIPLVD